MANCSDCKHYEAKDETSGNCFGHEITGDTDTSNCPANAYSPKEA